MATGELCLCGRMRPSKRRYTAETVELEQGGGRWWNVVEGTSEDVSEYR